jgi:nucleoside-diphosphate-sugar epimerase
MSRTAFVTGAAGFVGATLVRELIAQGWQVNALVRDTTPPASLAGQGAIIHHGDITDGASLAAALPQGVDCVFHVAASTNTWARRNDLQTQVNVQGTRNVVDAAIAAGAGRLVHTSSFSVWGFHSDVLNEDCAWREQDGWINYIASKREAETIVRQAADSGQMDVVICNPAHILGPGDRRNWSRMIRLVDDGRLPGVPPGGGAFADVREVARAHVVAADKGRNGVNYLLGGEDLDFIDVIRITGEILGKPVPARATPAWQMRLAARISGMKSLFSGREPVLTPETVAMMTHHVRCDSARAQRELDYRTTAVRPLLEDTCAWLRAEGLIG